MALAHAGWVAIDLRRRLRDAILGVVVIDWIVTPPPPEFLTTLERMRDHHAWRATLDDTLLRWAADVDEPGLVAFLDQMAGHARRHVGSAAREVEELRRSCAPALWRLSPLWSRRCRRCTCTPSPTTTPICTCRSSTPRRTRGSRCSGCRRASHFPQFEVAELMGEAINGFVRDLSAGRGRRAA